MQEIRFIIKKRVDFIFYLPVTEVSGRARTINGVDFLNTDQQS